MCQALSHIPFLQMKKFEVQKSTAQASQWDKNRKLTLSECARNHWTLSLVTFLVLTTTLWGRYHCPYFRDVKLGLESDMSKVRQWARDRVQIQNLIRLLQPWSSERPRHHPLWASRWPWLLCWPTQLDRQPLETVLTVHLRAPHSSSPSIIWKIAYLCFSSPLQIISVLPPFLVTLTL